MQHFKAYMIKYDKMKNLERHIVKTIILVVIDVALI